MPEAPKTLPPVASQDLAPPEGHGPKDPYGPVRFARANRFSELSSALRRAHLLLALLGLLTVGLLGGLLFHSTRTHIQPYIVEVDRHGQPVAAGPAAEMPEPDRRMILHALSLWLIRTRTVTTDRQLQRREIVQAYAYTRGPAVAHLNDWFRDSAPFKRADQQTVSVEIESILALDDTLRSFRLEWTETVRSAAGAVIREEPWQALVTLEVDPPERTEEVLTNPLGIFVVSFDWQRLVNS